MIRMFPAFASGLLCLALLSSASSAESADNKSPGAAPSFEVADVHSSVHSNQPFVTGGTLRGERFILHQATMVDLVAKAYGVENNNVLSGPAWLEMDRFDILARAPRITSPDDVRLMLRALLEDRFKLVAHADTKSLPAFVLSAGKGSSKLTVSDGSGASDCKFIEPPPNPPAGTVPLFTFSCHNTTMETLTKGLRNWAGDYLTNPVVDTTGLKGSFDFDIKFHSKGRAARAGANAITIYDAVEKQLGLKLEAKTAPLPVVIVDSVNEKPTPNAPGLDKALPPAPPGEFDVAVIKPSAPDARSQGRIQGNQVNVTGTPLKFLITFAWDIGSDMVAGAPKWVETDNFDIIAKAAVPETQAPGPSANPIEIDDLRQMIKGLLADRFKMQVHMEERPADAYTLYAANPKMKKADPLNRTGCKEGPGPDGKDPRIANPILGRLLTCQNMTMKQFGELLQIQASGYIHVPVLDATGLEGAYDFTLSFSTSGQLRPGNGGGPPPPSTSSNASASEPTDPTGGLSLFDAVNKQLGLKLEKQKRPVPMLVIDHIEKPTEN